MTNSENQFDDQFRSALDTDVEEWIKKTKFHISTGVAQAGIVRKARYVRSLKIFLLKYLACSKNYPIGRWKIKVQLPAQVQPETSEGYAEKNSLRESIDRAGLEVFYPEFPYEIKASPYNEKLPFTTGSHSDRLALLGSHSDQTFDIEKYEGSKPIEKNYPDGFPVIMMMLLSEEELVAMQIMASEGLDS